VWLISADQLKALMRDVLTIEFLQTDIFGKKNRSFFARHDILEKLKLK
jgi:hypothetical protein